MKRVLLLLADRQHTRLQTQQQAGLDVSAATLSLDPAQSQVLKRLLSTPGQLRLMPSNVAQFSALLPGNLKALFPSEHLLLRSVANNGRVVMLVVADQGGQPLNDVCLQAFGKTVQCIERALGFAHLVDSRAHSALLVARLRLSATQIFTASSPSSSVSGACGS